MIARRPLNAVHIARNSVAMIANGELFRTLIHHRN
jgi:hypothetical protein